MDGQIKHVEAEQDHQRRLTAHHQKLCRHVREQNLHSGNTGNQAPLQNSFVSLDQHRTGSQCHRQEEDDTAEQTKL